MTVTPDGVTRQAQGFNELLSVESFIIGGADFISGNSGHDILVGGYDTDVIRGNADDDILFGDFALLTWTNSALAAAKSVHAGYGDSDRRRAAAPRAAADR